MSDKKCFLCGSQKIKHIFNGKDRLLEVDSKEFPVMKCKNCGLFFLYPQPTPKELEKYYPQNYGPYGKKDMFKKTFITNAVKKLIHLLYSRKNKKSDEDGVQKSDTSKVRCLDFGCGDGAHMSNIRKIHPNWSIEGLDNSTIACTKARERGFKVLCGDVADVELPENYYDTVFMSSVIEHVHDPKMVLERLNKTLKVGGTIVIKTPNAKSLATKIFGNKWYALDTPRHLHLFSLKTLKLLLKQTGYELSDVSYKEGMAVEIKSFYYLIDKKDRRMNPITWRLLIPAGKLLAHLGLASTIIIRAKKAI